MSRKIAVYYPNNGFGTAMYRAIAPLSELRRKHDVDIVYSPINPEQIPWDLPAFYDLAFFSWPNFKGVENVIGAFHSFGVPVWVDFDDDPWNIKDDNITKAIYTQEVLDRITLVCEIADFITVSTPYLRDFIYAKFGEKVKCLPNCHNDRMYHFSETERNKCILWRGASGHTDDLLTVFKEIIELQKERPDWSWIFVGDPDPELMKLLNPDITGIKGHQHIQTFMKTLYDAAAAIQIIPLQNDEFNKSKSNCAWLEATAVGSAVVAPSFLPEFCKSGITNYDDAKDFKAKLLSLMDATQDERDALVRKSRFEVKKNYTLSTWNETRARMLGL